ncbi:hypothetical protein LTR10_023689 [Elasticomyces elasticus]|uniref:Tyrosinase copper-binding domain-containing protein n=1 Tax=Exophiala sideris TaxID=1016849 RepID=A0ABR0JHG3_9EURO|nr:hypothetical protein LTR10_023689 [Elasticomyces elasticus]KAK5033609.1 hypothetical protein LTS07_003914 [Exophiala sideris]KAK5041896.1 hypothetical protein LTR13_001701 [Exophiala sideris]KAK5064153.1 hypothetical protein LTR69_003922 [Exophiala sideris]KAK5185164.1 hypothetical protein LTR44_002152 [Eurotiomycetes sp. CCFEE 6388]
MLGSRIQCALALVLASIATSGVQAWPHGQSQCKQLATRKEWGSLTSGERIAYIDAVKCMQQKPSNFAPGVVPGAKSRFDDFSAVHINQTTGIHLDGVFLSWHRNFLQLWETALREECGYPGYQPYWNWPLWDDDLAASPLFDGSETSLGGDGYYDGSFTEYIVGTNSDGSLQTLPRGTGGGCMKDGPFVNMTINMGPFAFGLVYTGLPSNWTDYAPHCVQRDLNNAVAAKTNQTYVDAALATATINDFQNALSASGTTLGLHGAGHFCTGAGMQDFFASPSDPAFFLHHGQVDRIWQMWQSLDEGARTYGNNALFGTSTIFDANNTAPVSLDEEMNWGILGKPRKIAEMMQVGLHGFCYEYQ